MADSNPVVATRLALAEGDDQWSAHSTVAPHAPLAAVLTELIQLEDSLKHHEIYDDRPDYDHIAAKLRVSRGKLEAVLSNLNAEEDRRSITLNNAVEWYNALKAAQARRTATDHSEETESTDEEVPMKSSQSHQLSNRESDMSTTSSHPNIRHSPNIPSQASASTLGHSRSSTTFGAEIDSMAQNIKRFVDEEVEKMKQKHDSEMDRWATTIAQMERQLEQLKELLQLEELRERTPFSGA